MKISVTENLTHDQISKQAKPTIGLLEQMGQEEQVSMLLLENLQQSSQQLIPQQSNRVA